MPQANRSTSEAMTASNCSTSISAERMKRVRMPGPLGSGTSYFSMRPSTKAR